MAPSYENASSFASSGGAASTILDWTALGAFPSGQILVAVLGFEGVTGSGPWVSGTPQAGWKRLFAQGPSASGCALEVWVTNGWSSGPTTEFDFTGTYAYAARGAIFDGQYMGSGDAVRAGTSQPWTGNNPQTPSVAAFSGELACAVSAEQMSSPGYGSPATGFTLRLDSARSGAFGNVEITLASKLLVADGPTQATWSATGASGTSKGSTGIFLIRGPSTSPVQRVRAQIV